MGCAASRPSASAPATDGSKVLLGNDPGQKRATIDQDAVALKEETESRAGEGELAEARRSRQRKSTPFCKLGDAPVVDEEDEDEEDSPAKGQKKAVICPEAIRAKEDTEAQPEEALAEVRRTRQRKSTPFVRTGDAAAAADDDGEEEASEDGPSGDQWKATICEDAIRAKEQAEAQADAGELVEARRSRNRKSTPFCKPGDALPAAEDEDDTDEEGCADKKVAICADAIRLKEQSEAQADAGELAEVRRTRQRKSTPFTKLGDASVVTDDDTDEEKCEDKKVVIDEDAIRLKEHSEAQGDAGELAEVRRTRQRKSTPFCKIVASDDKDEDDAGSADGSPRRATLCQDAIDLKERTATQEGEVVDVRKVRAEAERWPSWLRVFHCQICATSLDPEEEVFGTQMGDSERAA